MATKKSTCACAKAAKTKTVACPVSKSSKSAKAKSGKSVKAEKVDKACGCAKVPYEYTPISMWGYFGYEFLFMIPVVGWILCVAFAFMADNHNLRNFARSQFCWLIINIVIVCVLAGVGVIATLVNALVK